MPTLLTALAAATPAPSPENTLRPGLDPSQVSPGLVGFLMTFVLTAAVVLLVIDFNRRNRRLRYRAQYAEQREAEEQAAAEAAAGERAGGDAAASPAVDSGAPGAGSAPRTGPPAGGDVSTGARGGTRAGSSDPVAEFPGRASRPQGGGPGETGGATRP